MIRGYFEGPPGRRRPFVTARLELATRGPVGEVEFLIDTGAESTILGPVDALWLRIDTRLLPTGPRTVGIGGRIATTRLEARLRLGDRPISTVLRLLAPRSRRQQQALLSLPSLLGRDVLRHFALVVEERTDRVLLLDPDEADALSLP
ncbi:MAG TPA: hypothetical protein VK066_13515 [Chloroflexota bacterium]|nr:hypothetical protein [Chloroflexota bacterium]